MIKTLNTLFVTMFGLGKLPKIPGTFGSLATIIILYALFHILNLSSNFILIGLVFIFIFSFLAVATHIKDSENKDPKEIIIDEFIGQSIPIYLYEISHGAKKFGNQCIVVAIDAKLVGKKWNVFINGGRIDTKMDAVAWAKKAVSMGAGEILLTSMDRDGTKDGYDLKLTETKLFERYLYVGSTRAATFLAFTAKHNLPEEIKKLKDFFVSSWDSDT